VEGGQFQLIDWSDVSHLPEKVAMDEY